MKVRISARVRQACDLLASGRCKTIKDAAARARLSREHLSRSLRKDHVRAYIDEKTRSALAIATLRAVVRLNELLDARSEAVAADAAIYVLKLAGIVPGERSAGAVNVTVTPGYVVMAGATDRPADELATALPTGALARQPDAEQNAGQVAKRPAGGSSLERAATGRGRG